MEYIYAAMLLHSAKKEVSEENLTAVVKASGVSVDSAKIKALTAALKDINIDEAIQKASTMAVAAAPAAAPAAGGEAKAKPKVEEAAKTEEEAAAGLAGLFG